MKIKIVATVISALFCLNLSAQESDWEPITSDEELSKIVGGATAVHRNSNGKEISRGDYFPDGTGVLYAWGAEIPRTWRVASGKLYIAGREDNLSYKMERSKTLKDYYRVKNLYTGEYTEFTLTKEKQALKTVKKDKSRNEGGVAKSSAAEIAAELANPNTAVATLTIRNQFFTYSGDLPGADSQSNYTMTFQPGLPFLRDDGSKIIWRPAIPLQIDRPTFNATTGSFDGDSGLGDIAFDLAYAPKTEPGLLLGYGFFTSLPTATDDALGNDKWTLGPELLLGKTTPNNVYGGLLFHQWDIAGSGDKSVNLTSLQAFYTRIASGGWTFGSGPIISYDWNNEQWTIPLQVNAGKTVILNGRPWKVSFEINYYVETPDAFGPEWMFSLNIAPVVKNGLADLFD